MRTVWSGLVLALAVAAQDGTLPAALQNRQIMPSPFQPAPHLKQQLVAPSPKRVLAKPEAPCTPPMPAMDPANKRSSAMPKARVDARVDAGIIVPARVCEPKP